MSKRKWGSEHERVRLLKSYTYVIRKMEKLTASLFLNCVSVELMDI